jgi:hypothetical protein
VQETDEAGTASGLVLAFANVAGEESPPCPCVLLHTEYPVIVVAPLKLALTLFHAPDNANMLERRILGSYGTATVATTCCCWFSGLVPSL